MQLDLELGFGEVNFFDACIPMPFFKIHEVAFEVPRHGLEDVLFFTLSFEFEEKFVLLQVFNCEIFCEITTFRMASRKAGLLRAFFATS